MGCETYYLRLIAVHTPFIQVVLKICTGGRGMKCEISEFVTKCLVKVEHQVPSKLLQSVMTDKQLERVIQVLEDTLRCCIFEFEGN
ncbi:putative Retrotransposon protein [Gossypium australe]|uniref:Putative Retrotransposon protein n=1 Tax=Gossypium australe TaxID=47621 RepID=A0A5B6VBF3_9ROSI|nr:putative Retrotransposon protein [Gossypium australe]